MQQPPHSPACNRATTEGFSKPGSLWRHGCLLGSSRQTSHNQQQQHPLNQQHPLLQPAESSERHPRTAPPSSWEQLPCVQSLASCWASHHHSLCMLPPGCSPGPQQSQLLSSSPSQPGRYHTCSPLSSKRPTITPQLPAKQHPMGHQHLPHKSTRFSSQWQHQVHLAVVSRSR